MPATATYAAIQAAEAQAEALTVAVALAALALKPRGCPGASSDAAWLTVVVLRARSHGPILRAAEELAGWHGEHEHKPPRPPKVDDRSREGM